MFLSYAWWRWVTSTAPDRLAKVKRMPIPERRPRQAAGESGVIKCKSRAILRDFPLTKSACLWVGNIYDPQKFGCLSSSKCEGLVGVRVSFWDGLVFVDLLLSELCMSWVSSHLFRSFSWRNQLVVCRFYPHHGSWSFPWIRGNISRERREILQPFNQTFFPSRKWSESVSLVEISGPQCWEGGHVGHRWQWKTAMSCVMI